MQDTQLYQQILGLVAPWRVTGVSMKRETRTIEVAVECADQVWCCPECGQRAHLHDYETRRWRHLDSCQFKTLLVANVPRVKCPDHGTVTVKVPWAEKHSRFTTYFERLAIDLMLECSISGACELMGISWAEADGIKQRAVRRGLARKPAAPMPALCVDEKSFGRGHDYVTLVLRAPGEGAATVQHIADGRTKEALDGFWKSLTPEQLGSVRAVAMDMWEPYLLSTRAHLPDADAKIVHDPFHLVRHLNDAVDAVRRSEHKALLARGDARLSNSRQVWLYGFERLPEKWEARMDELRTQKLKTARAWAIKEMFRELWTCRNLTQGRAFFADWFAWAIRSRLAPIRRAARMMKRHVEQILTIFVHRLTNAAAEGMNNKIQGLIKKAFGYRNRHRFKTDILFHCGGLELYPAFSQ